MDLRDRDDHGRPRNARARDGLGRPLPHGSLGVPRIDEDEVLSPAESLASAQRLLDDGMPFHAHEVLEAAWKNAPAPERELWRGLAQLAVGITHLRRGNTRGGVRLLARGGASIDAYAADPPHGIDVAGLLSWLSSAAASADATADAPAPRLCTSAPG